MVYKPTDPVSDPQASDFPSDPEPEDPDRIENPSVAALQENYPDVVGWLTMEGTGVDYPFVFSGDNEKYLRRNLDLEYRTAGTLFLDGRNSIDLSDFCSIVYGHNMHNKTMFGTLDRYSDPEFLEQHHTGALYLRNKTVRFEVIAYLPADSEDPVLYALQTDPSSQKAFVDRVMQAPVRREIALTEQDRFLLFSTCAYDREGARIVIVARILP